MSSMLISCQNLKSKRKTVNPNQVEWGEAGQTPTIWEQYDWVCGDRNTYRLEKR